MEHRGLIATYISTPTLHLRLIPSSIHPRAPPNTRHEQLMGLNLATFLLLSCIAFCAKATLATTGMDDDIRYAARNVVHNI